MEAKDRFCKNFDMYDDNSDIDKYEKIMQCQQNCTARSDCVGISYSFLPKYDAICNMCLDDTLFDTLLDVGFYRRPGIIRFSIMKNAIISEFS